MTARRLSAPDPAFHSLALDIEQVEPSTLFRISAHATGEPYFGRSGGNRFDDPKKEYGTCYAGLSLITALAESLLHDLIPRGGKYRVSVEDVERRFVHSFEGATLRLANLTGSSLNRLGGHGELSGTPSYELPQAWSTAVFEHPATVDGFIYMSRLMNTEKALVLFNRGNSATLKAKGPRALTRHPDYLDAELKLAITLT